jgi:acyl-CoA thioesterase FadM
VVLTNRLAGDPDLAMGGHMPFFEILRASARAYAAALVSLSDGLISARDMALVNLNSDFRGEMFAGEAVFDVAVQRLGSSSVTLAMELSQQNRPAAAITVVLVHVDERRGHSVPFSAAQRAALERGLP